MISVNIFVSDSEKAMEFYAKAFGAKAEKTYFDRPIGEKGASFFINEARFAMVDENAKWGSKSPKTLGGAPLCIQLYVDKIEEVIECALNCGAVISAPGTAEKPIFTTPQGIVCCNITDPFGFIWSVSKK